MFEFQVTDFEEFSRRLEELKTAFGQLNGKLCEVHFEPSRPDQVQAAIQTMERAVDERLSKFQDNPLVQQLSTGIKEKFKEEILKLASEARRQLASGGIPFDPLNTSAFLGRTRSMPLKGWNSARPTRRRTI